MNVAYCIDMEEREERERSRSSIRAESQGGGSGTEDPLWGSIGLSGEALHTWTLQSDLNFGCISSREKSINIHRQTVLPDPS